MLCGMHAATYRLLPLGCPANDRHPTPARPCLLAPLNPQGAGVTSTIRSNIANLNDYRVGLHEGRGCVDCYAPSLPRE